MGRLDDNAKHRIVVLRKAGLSFRKIKKVLELDNIKVTPQAIYLFLKRKKIEPEKPTGTSHGGTPLATPQSWGQAQLVKLMHENGGQNKECGPQAPKNKQVTSDLKQENNDTGIKIVSVTSLSKINQAPTLPSCDSRSIPQGQTVQETRPCTVHPAPNPALNGPRPNPTQPAYHNPINGRARTLLPAVKNPVLLVTKKIVDRAINLQKKVILQNGLQPPNHGGPYALPTLVTNHQTISPAASAHHQHKDASTQTYPAAKTDVSTEQLDSIRGELHKLTQVMQSLIERQSRWEQEQMRQRHCNHQEVLSQIQQLGATLVAKMSQNCAPFTSAQELEAPLPDLGNFKMEL
ncbi:uncharacterized protein PAF06_014043 [Gastrophryne carolinensis]